VEIHLWFFAKKTAFFVNLKNINSKNAFNSNILIFRTLVVRRPAPAKGPLEVR